MDPFFREGLEGVSVLKNPTLQRVGVSASVDLYQQAEHEISVMPTIIGITTENYSSRDEIQADIDQLNSKGAGIENYKGVALFDFTRYQKLSVAD